jgi:hypothetical protein
VAARRGTVRSTLRLRRTSGAVLPIAELHSAGIHPDIDDRSIAFTTWSDHDVRATSSGRIRKPETYNMRTFKPEKDGLFCERVFGPERDWECYCGKFKGRIHAGKTCDRCGVLIVDSGVRHRRTGHIELAAPVLHPWYASLLPERLGLSAEQLHVIVNYGRVVVADSDTVDLVAGQIIDDGRILAGHRDNPGVRFALGAEAVEILLRTRPGPAMPAGLILRSLPVLPPNLRPMLRRDSGSMMTSDLNDLYRRVINRNNRISRLQDLGAPPVIIHDERRKLQASVDTLLGNERCASPVTDPRGRVLVSVGGGLTRRVMRAKTLREGVLFRPVDFSAAARLVAGATPDSDTVLLPDRLAMKLFEPLVDRPRDELDDRLAGRLVLLVTEQGPWPLFAVRFRTTPEASLRVHPDLLDIVGWENLGERAAIFAVLTADASQEATRLLPTVLDVDHAAPAAPPSRDTPCDFAGAEFLENLPHWVATGRKFPLTRQDAFLLAPMDPPPSG